MRVALFREAVDAPAWRNLAKTAVQVVVLWTLALWVVPVAIVRALDAMHVTWLSVTPLPVAGWVLLSVASAVGLWSAATMARLGRGTPLPLDHARALVVAGPYAYVRNPMAVTGLAQGLGVALVLGSVAVALYVAAGGALWNWIVRPLEEQRLTEQFGDSYGAYQRAVRCWRPRLAPYTPAAR